VVVAVGLTFVEPLAAADVKVPGEMATPVAPGAVQLSVLLAPELILAGFAAKELIVGPEDLPPEEFEAPPQPASPIQAERRRSSVSFAILGSGRDIENVNDAAIHLTV
jgi:hypothetical protein